jgi:hypothetical protein
VLELLGVEQLVQRVERAGGVVVERDVGLRVALFDVGAQVAQAQARLLPTDNRHRPELDARQLPAAVEVEVALQTLKRLGVFA